MATKLAAIVALCAVISVVAGCGGSSLSKATAPQGPTQQARQTPSLSNADVGGSSIQQAATAPARRTASGKPTGTRTSDTVVASGKVQKARLTPSSSKDDNRKTVSPQQMNPCTLVSISEARSITAGAIVAGIEAPLGPTCIYRTHTGSSDVTLAVESLDYAEVTRQLAKPTRLLVGSRRVYCGRLGAQMLFVPLPGGKVLNVTAPCAVAQRFAALALTRLAA